MNTIIGWQNDLDASAALVVDGSLVACAQEERFTRVKQQDGFPRESIEWLLASNDLDVDDVDEWPYGWFAGANTDLLLPDLCRRVAAGAGDPEAVDVMVDRLASEYTKDSEIRRQGLREADAFGIPASRITYVEHHRAHAWSAFACSPFSRSLVVTADGRGDRKAITVSRGDVGGLTELQWYSSIDSVGHLYCQVTHALGFKPNRHEGKITGLAGFGDGREAARFLRTLIDWEGDRIVARAGRSFRPTATDIPPRTLEVMRSFRREDLAAGVQIVLEDLITKLVVDSVEKHGETNVSLAGGVFANVQLNRRIRSLPCVSAVFVQPNMGDGGLALGAAADAWNRVSGQTKIALPHVYLGPEPDPTTRHDIPSTPFDGASDQIEELVSELLVPSIVGLVRGRSEFGPRALGHRSILARAVDPDINRTLNERLRRTEFMPFAPIIRADDAAASFRGWTPEDRCAPFMTMAYECAPSFVAQHPAVVHVDGTARPQVVTRDEPFLYDLLTAYAARTGEVALVNTSFNAHEEPIVQTLDDALNALDAGRVDSVWTEDAVYGALHVSRR
jgi:carbamoyltransferase